MIHIVCTMASTTAEEQSGVRVSWCHREHRARPATSLSQGPAAIGVAFSAIIVLEGTPVSPAQVREFTCQAPQTHAVIRPQKKPPSLQNDFQMPLRDYPERASRPDRRLTAVAGRAHERLDQCPQKAGLVHRAPGTCGCLLAGVIGGHHHRAPNGARRMGPLSLGWTPSRAAMTTRLLAQALSFLHVGDDALARRCVRINNL